MAVKDMKTAASPERMRVMHEILSWRPSVAITVKLVNLHGELSLSAKRNAPLFDRQPSIDTEDQRAQHPTRRSTGRPVH